MAEPVVSFIVENDEDFRRGLKRMAEVSDDFRIPFNLIGNDWYRSNRKIFTLASKGLYQDLAPAKGDSTAGGITTTSNYKDRKEQAVGFVYPILARSGRLASSLLDRNDPDAVFLAGRRSLTMGSDVPYLKYHQSDRPRSKIPQRKAVFIDGGPAERARDASISGRRERWLNIMNQYVLDNIDEYNKGNF